MTIKEIAEKAGVSIGTVDRVLHGRGRVSPGTSERVRRIVRETEYRPNPHASSLSSSRKYSLAVLAPLPEQDDGFWKIPAAGFRQAAAGLEKYSVTLSHFAFDRYCERSFWKQARAAAASRPDGLILAPVLPGPSRRFLEGLPTAPPCVFFDSDLPGWQPLTFIGQDSLRSGVLAAKLMRLLAGQSAEVLAVQPVVQDAHIAARIRGFLSGFPAAACPAVAVEERLEDPAACIRFMDRLLADRPALGGIFVANASVRRVAEYLESAGCRSVRLIGYDLTPENQAALRRGGIDFLISQRPDRQAAEAVQALFRKLAWNQDPPPRVVMPIDILCAENIDYYEGGLSCWI